MYSGSESDNEMPESVPFQNSKTLALKEIKDLKESLERDKSIRKNIRYEREQRNLQQKQSKLLSAEVLRKADISIKQQEEKKQILNKLKEDQLLNEKVTSEDNVKDNMEEQYVNLHQIPEKPSDDAAKLFLEKKLFGARIRRVTAKKQKRLQRKKKYTNF